MKFHITIDDEDFISYNTCHFLNTPRKKWPFLILALVFVTAIYNFSVLLLSGYGAIKFNVFTAGVVVALYVVLIGYILVFFPREVRGMMRREAKKLKKEGKLPYQSEYTMEFLEEELCETTASSVRRVKYADMPRILRDKEHIYVMVSAMEAAILPVRCLEGREQELLDFLNNKMQKTGRK